MKVTKPLTLTLVFLSLIGCSTEKSPSQIYEEYNSRVTDGVSYEEEKAYYTKQKQQEVESKLPQYMKQMNKSRDDVIELYLNLSREVAKCKEITLDSEVIEGDTALLEYSQKDVCGNKSATTEKQKVRMKNEGGWKIDEVVISL